MSSGQTACLKSLIEYILSNALNLPRPDWTVQGFGFMRLRVDMATRLHIWDSRLRVDGVSDIHDHTQWAFTSHIISGRITNTRYLIDPTGNTHRMATLNCGVGGGMCGEPAKFVGLVPQPIETYLPGDHYHQDPDEVHRTDAMDGTITLLQQQRRDIDTARVFWPRDKDWGDAIPRQATYEEIHDIGGSALDLLMSRT